MVWVRAWVLCNYQKQRTLVSPSNSNSSFRNLMVILVLRMFRLQLVFQTVFLSLFERGQSWLPELSAYRMVGLSCCTFSVRVGGRNTRCLSPWLSYVNLGNSGSVMIGDSVIQVLQPRNIVMCAHTRDGETPLVLTRRVGRQDG